MFASPYRLVNFMLMCTFLKESCSLRVFVMEFFLQASRETLLCVLDCFARLLVMPEEVEEEFVERMIKAFTRVCVIILECV